MSAKHLLVAYSGNFAYSDDLSTGWDLAVKGSDDIRSLITIADDKVYAFTSGGKVLSTTSGATWAEAHSFEHPCIRAAFSGYNDDILVALDNGYMGGRKGGYVSWSQWRQRSDGLGVFDVAGLREGETPPNLDAIRWVVVGDGGYLAVADGWIAVPGWLQWETPSNPFEGTTILAAERGDGMWVAAGALGKLATSPDGLNWTLRDSGFGLSCIYRLAYDLVLGWLAVGAEGKVSKSLDGFVWEPVDMAAESDCAIDFSGRRVSHRWLGAMAEGDSWMVVGDEHTLATITVCPSCYYYQAEPPPPPPVLIDVVASYGGFLDYSNQSLSAGSTYSGLFKVLLVASDGTDRYATVDEITLGATYVSGGFTVSFSAEGGDLFRATVSPPSAISFSSTFSVLVTGITVGGTTYSGSALPSFATPRLTWS